MSSESFNTIPEAIEAIRRGDPVIMVDDENRENEGDFVFAAEHITADKVNFLALHARGLICVPAPESRMDELGLGAMVPPAENNSLHSTAFRVSVDARTNATTGISSADRYEAIRLFTDPEAKPSDLVRPGHIFPIAARSGGVLVRAGHTEGGVDLARLAGLQPVAVICEILKDDGSMARLPDLREIAREFECPLVTIKDLIAYRMETERLVRKVVSVHIPNPFGDWELTMYDDTVNGETHLAMVLGEVGPEPTLVRVHSQCFTGDTLLSQRCDCGSQLHAAMAQISVAGSGVIVYMHQEGRGIGLRNKLLAYKLQEEGKDTVEANEALGFKADLREYGIGAQILADLGLKKIRIMTNNPRKIIGIQSFGLEVVEKVPIQVGLHKHNAAYLVTKANKLGHDLDDDIIEKALAMQAEKDKTREPGAEADRPEAGGARIMTIHEGEAESIPE